jgi:hypothetical protein
LPGVDLPGVDLPSIELPGLAWPLAAVNESRTAVHRKLRA